MAQAGVSANRLELLQIADAVAREKSIDRQVVITAMEDAIQKAAKSRYGSENEIRAEVDPKTGEIRLARLLEVVEVVTMEVRLTAPTTLQCDSHTHFTAPPEGSTELIPDFDRNETLVKAP